MFSLAHIKFFTEIVDEILESHVKLYPGDFGVFSE